MEIRQLIRDIRRNAVVAVAAFVLCVVVGAAAAYLPAKKYTADTLVAVSPVNTQSGEGPQTIPIITPQLPPEVTSQANYDAVRLAVPEPYRAEGASLSATADEGSFIVTISATSADAVAASKYANAAAARLIRTQPDPGTTGYQLKQIVPAVPPSKPANPRLPVVLGSAAFGVILGIFAAMWAAGIRRRLSRVQEVKERIGAPVLGEIPRTGMPGPRPAELFVKHSEPLAMEAFQELRSNLLISLPAGASAAIAVTSCDPGEGKTSVATNIAWALAAQDRHVTAIDCDLRKPALHTQMGVPFGPGVTSRRTEDALAHASRTTNPHLDVIPAGIIDRHPSDIVSAHLPLLIEELRARNETTVIDCPPLVGVAETVLIAAMVDLVIVVVDARRFNPERLQQCLLRLEGANSNVSIVLNRVRFNRKRRDGAYGYGHFRRTETPPAAPGGGGGPVRPRTPRAPSDRSGPRVLRPPADDVDTANGTATSAMTAMPDEPERSGYWRH